MIYKNFETYPIALTILTPIHIGCGEVYEPTNFVADVESNKLYSFDPFTIKLPDNLKTDLSLVAVSWSFVELYKFYLNNINFYKSVAKAIVEFDSKLKYKFDNIKNYKEPGEARRCLVPRVSYCDTEGTEVPYIPGSSIKGAVHTALLDRLSKKYRHLLKKDEIEPQKIDKYFFGEEAEKTPLKLLSISDLHCAKNAKIRRKIILAERVYNRLPNKKKDNDEEIKRPLQVAFEVIQKAQFRSFTGSMTLRKKHEKSTIENEYQTLRDVFKDLNKYSCDEFEEEYQRYWKNYESLGTPWMKGIKKLLEENKKQLDEGNIALIRIGENCGARNLTLRDKGLPQIIVKGHPQENANTMFVALDKESRYPFGWALLEFTGLSDGVSIKSWTKVAVSEEAKDEQHKQQKLAAKERELKKGSFSRPTTFKKNNQRFSKGSTTGFNRGPKREAKR